MAFVEVDYRRNDFVSVSLLWDTESRPNADSLSVELSIGDDVSRFPVTAESALDAFNHPFAYEPLSAANERMLRRLAVPVPDEPEDSDDSGILV
jgi:hypothetical protein